MSTAEAEKPLVKPAAPLGSFLKKIEAKPAPVVEPKQETEVRDVIVNPDKPVTAAPAKEAGTPEPIVEGKIEEKPSEEKIEKRLKDAQTWANEEHKARLDAERKTAALEEQLARIEAKLDGTYEEPVLPSIEQVKTDAETTGRIRASHKAAVRQYGLNFVMETVWNKESPYMKLQARDPRVRERVWNAEDPVLEAIDCVKEDQDGEKYGRTPEEIRKKMEAELAPKLKQDILEGLKTKPGPAANTLRNVSGGTERTEQKNGAPQGLDFRKVFPWGASRL